MKKNRQICRLLLFLILIFITIPGMYGQKYIVPWANTFTEHGWDRVAAITSDTGNNIILVGVLGAFDKSCDIGQSHYNSRNFHNYVPKKYASITISLSEIFILCKTELSISEYSGSSSLLGKSIQHFTVDNYVIIRHINQYFPCFLK